MTLRHRDDLPGARPGRRADRRREHLPRPRAVARSASPSAAAADRAGRASCSPGSATPRSAPTAEVGSLSAAGQQIVSMARALSHDARLIVMDEPSAVLDSEEVAATSSGSSAT